MISILDPTERGNKKNAVWPSRSSILARQVQDGLRAGGYLALRDVTCEVRDGVAFLEGRLRSHHLKQIAQAIAGGVEGIVGIENQIEVTPLIVAGDRRRFGEPTCPMLYRPRVRELAHRFPTRRERAMLILSRKSNESILIGDNIRITVTGIRGRYVRLGIEAPEDVSIFREELCAGQDEVPSPSDRANRRRIQADNIPRSVARAGTREVEPAIALKA